MIQATLPYSKPRLDPKMSAARAAALHQFQVASIVDQIHSFFLPSFLPSFISFHFISFYHFISFHFSLHFFRWVSKSFSNSETRSLISECGLHSWFQRRFRLASGSKSSASGGIDLVAGLTNKTSRCTSLQRHAETKIQHPQKVHTGIPSGHIATRPNWLLKQSKLYSKCSALRKLRKNSNPPSRPQ